MRPSKLRGTTLCGMLLAAAAFYPASLALADESCLPDANGAQCDLFFERYRADDVPVGTTNVWTTHKFVLERYRDPVEDPAVETPAGDDVLYWDGDSAMVVPENTGPRIELSDW